MAAWVGMMSTTAEIVTATWVLALLLLGFCPPNPIGAAVARAAIEEAVAQPVQNLHDSQPRLETI
jgi:hypothetical protein